jgi:hypothetical protein
LFYFHKEKFPEDVVRGYGSLAVPLYPVDRGNPIRSHLTAATPEIIERNGTISIVSGPNIFELYETTLIEVHKAQIPSV